MKIIYAGTPEFAAVALQALHAAGHDIVLTLTQPDRPAGRGMQMHASAVKQFALAHDIPVAQPVSLRLDGKHGDVARQAHALLENAQADVMVVAAYGLILPRSVLTIPTHGCLNIHASLLPRWRGAAPIHRAIEAGDSETGITIMQMDEGLDTGPMLLTQRLAIGEQDTTGSLHDRLAALGGEMIVTALEQLQQKKLQAVSQPDTGVTYAAKIAKDEARLDLNAPAAVVARKIRAFNPFPGAFAEHGGIAIKFWHAMAIDEEKSVGAPGQVLQADAQGIVIACGSGAIRVTELQKPGSKRLGARDFLQGFALAGTRFGQ